MAQYPALPLFTDAFIADTTHLTAAQTGAYIMLLIVAWRTPECALFDDDKLLARWARMDRRTWNMNKTAIMQFWKRDDLGRWYQGRLKDERKYVEDMSSRNSEASKTRWRKNNNSPNASAIRERCKTDPPTPKKEEVTKEDKSSSAAGAAQKPVDNSTSDQPVDFKKIVFNEGLRYLEKSTSKSAASLRPIVAVWCRDFGDAATATAIMQSQQFSAVDPIAYITNFLKEKKNETTKNHASGGARESKSAEFKRRLVEGTLADLEQQPERAKEPG